MRPTARTLLSLPLLLGLLVPVAAQSLGVDVFNTRRELSGRMWGSGHWIAFCVDEDLHDLNGDGDNTDTVLSLVDVRTGAVRDTGLAVDYAVADSDEEWPVAISGELIAVQVSEADQGGRDLDGNKSAEDNVLVLFNPQTRQVTSLGVTGRSPAFLGGKLYFTQLEPLARKDLNGDRDVNDAVLCVVDPQTRQVESLGTDAAQGFQVAGDWIAALTSEAAQGGRDLNGDRDANDVVPQLYQVSQRKWTNTGVESSAGIALTPHLLAMATEELRQGAADLNGDGMAKDVVCQVRDLSTATLVNTGRECAGGIAADGNFVGILTREAAGGAGDLNGDGDTRDEVAQVFVLGMQKPLNIGYEASGGLAAGGGKLALMCSEVDQARRDLNRDMDTDDFVLMVYDPARNRIVNTGYAVDGDLTVGEGTLAWKVLEADQGERDLNRDRDADDSIQFVMDLKTGAFSPTGYASGEYGCATERGVGFASPELDQGERDLNMDTDADDEIAMVARVGRR